MGPGVFIGISIFVCIMFELEKSIFILALFQNQMKKQHGISLYSFNYPISPDNRLCQLERFFHHKFLVKHKETHVI